MSTRLYVGDLSLRLRATNCRISFPKPGLFGRPPLFKTGRPGNHEAFAFLIMSSNEDARSAILKFNRREFQGRNLMVNEARLSNVRARRSRNPFVATNAKSRSLVGFRHLNRMQEARTDALIPPAFMIRNSLKRPRPSRRTGLISLRPQRLR